MTCFNFKIKPLFENSTEKMAGNTERPLKLNPYYNIIMQRCRKKKKNEDVVAVLRFYDFLKMLILGGF